MGGEAEQEAGGKHHIHQWLIILMIAAKTLSNQGAIY